MTRTLLATVAVVLAAVASPAVASAHGVGPAGISAHTVPFDLQYIDRLAEHHQMQVEMGMMAMRRARHAELRAFARKVVTDQRKELRDLSKLRREWYGDGRFQKWPMDEMEMRMMGMGPNTMAGLMRSPRFDFAWLSAVIPHHASAITMSRWATQEADHRVLRLMAKNVIRKQAGEIGEMISMRQRWYG